MNAFSALLRYFQNHPIKIFLLDGAGALLTSASIAGVNWFGGRLFGLPEKVLTLLSSIAFFFAIYSLATYLSRTKSIRKFLLPIMIANLLYCILSAGVVLFFSSELTLVGFSYFIFEIVVILTLVYMEYKIYKS
ncbi:MAG: hypothetical protein KDC49_05800 [Saprospiraceae bacterium]|nr:hypothetical protein [Saprospiraceae bacterium]